MNNSYEDWGYKFTYKASKNFVLDIEPALEENLEFQNPQDIAEQLMFDLFGQTHHLFYLTRQGQGKEIGEQIWGLTIATDSDGLELPERLEKRGLTLGLIAAVNSNGYGGLKILSTRLLLKHKGKQDAFSAPFYLRLRSNYKYGIGVPQKAIERITVLPLLPTPPTEEQLKAWKAFLKVEERLAREKQFCVTFVSHNYGEATRNITFKIDPRSATVDSQAENSITLDEFWQRAKRARNQNIKLRENNSRDRDGRELGTIEFIDSERNLLKISLDSGIFDSLAEGHCSLPQEALLSFEAVGDLVQIGWKKKALKNLEKGWTQNPYLGQFLFDASQAREPRENIQIQPQDLLLKTINSSQKAAVETVLSAPDLALIQGPPGTGKTTVIAEICYQVALRGGRTLIASQANLAVDNALSRLQHNSAIRAVRKGNKNSVGIEGEPFLEENVVKTWLQNTSADCEQRLNEKLELAKILRQLLASSEQFAMYQITEEKFQPKQKQLIAHQEILEANYQNQLKAYAIAQDKQDQLESLSNNLTDIVTSTSSINWDEPTIFGCLTKLTPYTDTDDSVERLAINVNKVTILAKGIGLFLPECGLFALAGWLQDNLLLKLAEAHQILYCAKNAESAMVEANFAWHTFQQNLVKESELKQEQQQISNTIQNHQQQITTLQECSDLFQNIISELNLSIKPYFLQVFGESQSLSVRFADYVETESKVNSQQKLLEESKVTIELDYQAQTKKYKEAEEKEREIEFLKTDLDALQTKAPAVNWYEPEVINLLARLQPYINKETSAQELTKNVAVTREIAIEFGILPPEHQLFGMAGWLHKAVSPQLSLIRTALSYAQDTASAMVKVDSAVQALMKNKNFIAQLESEKSKITKKRTEFQKELNSLNLQKCKIELAIGNLNEWSRTASLKLYEAINRCFQQQQSLTEHFTPVTILSN
ncbi:MAG: AAA family ATPase [Hyellaceae cyanobacterium CSU_1_1]|nr:AAA family ATPase [Hyellaceae cyanobacterium CSU_1_1]